jgi:hypothetical protein
MVTYIVDKTHKVLFVSDGGYVWLKFHTPSNVFNFDWRECVLTRDGGQDMLWCSVKDVNTMLAVAENIYEKPIKTLAYDTMHYIDKLNERQESRLLLQEYEAILTIGYITFDEFLAFRNDD